MPRYIDADEFVKRVIQYSRQSTKTIGLALADTPTADVQEVKHGKWVNHKGLYQCSCCKHIWSELWWVESCPMERMYKIMPFYPNCGAKMDGEENDNAQLD